MAEQGKVISIIESQIKGFVEEIRPLEEDRDQIDIVYEYTNNILIISEKRPRYDKEGEYGEYPFVKTRFFKTRGVWAIYWMRASGNWEKYQPALEVDTITDFFKIVKEDEYSCFFG